MSSDTDRLRSILGLHLAFECLNDRILFFDLLSSLISVGPDLLRDSLE